MLATTSPRLEHSSSKPESPAQGLPRSASSEGLKTDSDLNQQISQLEMQQKQFEKKVVKTADNLARGAQNNLDSSETQLKECGFIERMSGVKASIEKQHSTDKQHAKDTKEHYEKTQDTLKQSKQNLVEAKSLIDQAANLEKSGNPQQAAEMRQQAQELLTAASDSLSGTKAINKEHSKKAMDGYKESSRLSAKASSRLETAEKVTEVVKEVNHTVGVGVGFALGGPAGAALVNQGLRMVESGASEITSVAIGSKTGEQALNSFGKSTKDAAIESLITGVAGAAGSKLGKVVGGLASPLAAKAADVAGTGVVAAGGEAIQVGYEYLETRQQFIKDNPGLKGKELDAELDKHMAERNLDLQGISKRLGVSLASGAASKLVGNLLSGKATEGIVAGMRQQAAEQVGDITGNAGQMAANGQQMSTSDVVTSLIAGVANNKLTSKHNDPEDHSPSSRGRHSGPVRHPAAPDISVRPTLDYVVNEMLNDTKHRMNLTENLKSPKESEVVAEKLKEIAAAPEISSEQFKQTVRDTANEVKKLFPQDDRQHNYNSEGERRTVELRRNLLEQDPELNQIGASPSLSAHQKFLLSQHADRLKTEITPKLHEELRSIAGEASEDGFPQVNSRAKDAVGIINKIERMQQGNDGKSPRPDYILADMPDAAAGRITVKSLEDLGRICQALDEKFAGRIIEKDNFYTNPEKSDRPYRVITYTVSVDGVPCEIQLTTLSSSIAADINHNTTYKPIVPTTDAQKSEINDWFRGANAKELIDYQDRNRVK
jgi:ppGpp synthetase/RelA/SpoT-type nucleotidyltranferase